MINMQCMTCANYVGMGCCKAFPDGIPDKIRTGMFDHAKPHKGDGGIRYEKVKLDKEGKTQ